MRVPASGGVITAADKIAMHAVVDKGWLTAGAENRRFEGGLAAFTGIQHVRTSNSGSSANLLAVAAMVGAGLWSPGDEIVTVAACFPTTVNPLLLYGLRPVFVDITLPSYNVDVGQLERAISRKTRGIMLAHTLGNPFDLKAIAEIATGRSIHIVEDCCDALGATYGGQHVGAGATVATCSFFPAHHITTGEGGAVFTQSSEMARALESARDWGRDCWCEPGANNSCGKRFEWEFDGIPSGYDHKYTFTSLGFNLKLTEIQAACGVEQLKRLPEFVAARRRNYAFLSERLAGNDELILPTFDAGASPFGFPITLKESGLRSQMQKYLAQNGVDSRLLFAGNLVRQPYMKGRQFLVASDLHWTDKVMNDTFWVGLHPALSEEDLAYSAEMIGNFLGAFA